MARVRDLVIAAQTRLPVGMAATIDSRLLPNAPATGGTGLPAAGHAATLSAMVVFTAHSDAPLPTQPGNGVKL